MSDLSRREKLWILCAAVALVLIVLWQRGAPKSRTIDELPPRESERPRLEEGVPSSGEVFVHVAGAVARPGLYELTDEDRVKDAIDKAGGPLPEADLDRVNLAKHVADEEKITVPFRGEDEGSSSKKDGIVNLNLATVEELQKLPGVGEKTAMSIVKAREEAPFASVEDLTRVPGIGEKTLENLRPYVEAP